MRTISNRPRRWASLRAQCGDGLAMVGDRELLRGALAEALAAEGVTVLAKAEEGQRAISSVEQHKP